MSQRLRKSLASAGIFSGVLLTLGLGGGIDTARAQSTAAATTASAAPATDNSEVVVTARRKKERLLDVPEAVTAFTAEQLQAHAITDQVTLSNFTPGFQFSDYTNGRTDRGAFRALVFRGLAFDNTNAVTTPAMVFLDGAPVAFGDMLINDSIERVEILKGPQNVAFGRSTFTGAINYVTRNPGNVYAATLAVELGNYDDTKIDAHAEGPVIKDKLTFGLDLQYANKGGDYTDAATPSYKFGALTTKAIAGTLYATPTDDLSVKLYGTYFNYNDGLGATVIPPSGDILNCNPGGAGGTGNFFHCGAFPKINPAWIATTIAYTPVENMQLHDPAGNTSMEGASTCQHFGLCADNVGLSAIVNYKLPWYGITLQEITAYHKKDVSDLDSAVNQNVQTANPDFGNPAFPLAPPYSPTADYNIMNRITDFSSEIRLNSATDQFVRWTFGTNYVRTKDIQQLFFYEDPTGYIPPQTPGSTNGSVSATTVGVYGGVYYDIIKNVTLTGELRYQSDERIDQASANSEFFKKTFKSWNPRFSIEYKVTPEINVYASYSAGVRAGGFNTAIVGLPNYLLTQIAAQVGTAPVAYKEENLYEDEVGLKGVFFDHKLSTNIAVYLGRLTNEQNVQTAILPTPDPIYGGRFDVTNNIGIVDLHGVEADASWRVIRILTLSGTFAWNYTDVRRSYCQACFPVTGSYSINGNRLDNAPEYTFTLSADIMDKLTAKWDWFGHADFAYKGSIFLDENGLNLAQTGAAEKVNMEAGVTDSTYSISAWVTNLTDDQTPTGGADGFDFISFSSYGVRLGLPDRRAFGVRLKDRF